MLKGRQGYYAGVGFDVLAADSHYGRSSGLCRISEIGRFHWTGSDAEEKRPLNRP
jgi:hypothetical protein